MSSDVKPYEASPSDMSIEIGINKGLSTGSAFKFSFVSSATAISVLYIVQVLLTFIFGGESSFSFNGESPTTVKGLIFSLIALPFIVGVFSGFMAVTMVLGQWIYTKFKPLNLKLVEK